MKLKIGMDSMLKLLREFINQTGFAVHRCKHLLLCWVFMCMVVRQQKNNICLAGSWPQIAARRPLVVCKFACNRRPNGHYLSVIWQPDICKLYQGGRQSQENFRQLFLMLHLTGSHPETIWMWLAARRLSSSVWLAASRMQNLLALAATTVQSGQFFASTLQE